MKPASLPLFASPISAGFPSPADDYIERRLDLNRRLIRDCAATFIVRAEGESMIGAGIFSGDLLIVDRGLTANNGDIVVAVVDGEFLVKRLEKKGERVFLVAENPKFPKIELHEQREAELWGVVSYSIHKLSRR